MWIEQLPSGKYKAVERYTDPVTGKSKKISLVIQRDTRTERKAAQKRLDEKIEAILGKTDYDRMTLADLCSRYVDTYTRPTSKRTVKVMTDSLIKKLGPDCRINNLTALYVDDKLKAEQDVTYNNLIRRLKAMMKWAYSHDYLKDKSWLDKLRLRKDDRKARIEDKYLEADELKALLDNMHLDHWRLLTQFLALSGLRIGEALALTVADVDTYIHITKTIHVHGGEIMEGTKTTDSTRDVFVQPELAEVVKEIRQWRLSGMMKTGTRSDSFFLGLSYSGYCSYLNRLPSAKRLTPHIFRHTHVSLLAASGMSLDAIARRLGHSDSQITKEVYFHVTEKLRQQEEAQMERIRIL